MDYKLPSMKGKKALITGGLGFIGSNLAHKLVGLDAEITILDSMAEGTGFNARNIADINGKVRFIKGDIRDATTTDSAVRGADYIFHLAARSSHILSMKNPHADMETNLAGTVNILESCRKHNRQAKIVFSGTRTEIGKPKYNPVDEKHPENPSDVYGINKLAAEKYLFLYNKTYGIPATSLRLTNTYGPRHQMKTGDWGVVNWFIRKILAGETIHIYGDGSQIRDYNYVDDVCDALILAAQSEKSNGEMFLLGTGSGMKFIDMVKTLIKVAGTGNYQLVEFPNDRKAIDIKKYVADIGKIKHALGWTPSTDFESGVRKTVEFYRKELRNYM